MIHDIDKEYFDKKELEEAGEPVPPGAEVYLNSLRLQLVRLRVEDWMEQCPNRPTHDQFQAKVNEVGELALSQFSEQEIREAQYLLHMNLTKWDDEVDFEKQNLASQSGLEIFAQSIEAEGRIPEHGKEAIDWPAGADRVRETILRIRRLECANIPPVSVKPNGSIAEAVTLMVMHGFSQLPVMSGEREVKGIVSSKSIARCLMTRRVLDGRSKNIWPLRLN
jgi:hypothetical protein